jgi:hypothetical protein
MRPLRRHDGVQLMTWIQAAGGRPIDLMRPNLAGLDWPRHVAAPLARIARFTGHVERGPFSVAEHSVRTADAAFEETGDRALAAALVLHDAHEAFLGDLNTMCFEALVATVAAMATDGAAADRAASAVRAGWKLMKRRLDLAIFAAAGLPAPDRRLEAAVKSFDMRALESERRHLLGPGARAWGWDGDPPPPLRLRGGYAVWPWPRAADEWLAAFERHVVPAARALEPA